MNRLRKAGQRSGWRPWGLLILMATGCNPPGRPNPADRPVPANRVVDFSILYRENCSGCHGAQGKLGPAPPLNDPNFLAIVPDDVLARVIAEGRRGTPMPGFSPEHGGPLTDAQVAVLAKGLKPRWRPDRGARDGLPRYDAARSVGDKAKGAQVFAKACAGCHGVDGTGSDGGGSAGAIHDAAFLALISDQALRRLVITGRPDLGMPDYAGKDGRSDGFQPLTDAEIADLVALLADWRRGGSASGGHSAE